MFVLNNTIDDSDPLIIYNPPNMWYQGDNSTDPGSQYWMGTKTWTTTENATATFRFNGTSITVIGAKRNNHGNYSVTLDGSSQDFSGYASPDEFQAVLFNATNLTQGMHDVVITNTEGIFLDIDCVLWVSSVGDVRKHHGSEDTVVQDDGPGFAYGPAGAWNMSPEFLSQFNGSSGHSTSVPGAMVNYTFKGDAVSIYGTVGPNNSVYDVMLDDAKAGTYNAQKLQFQSGILLYHADNLGSGNHTVSLINGESSSLLEIDYAVVSSETASGYKSAGTLTLPTTSGGPSSSHSVVLTTGLVIVITLSVLFIIILLILLVWFLNRRNKTLWQRLQKGYMVQSQFDSPNPQSPILPIQSPKGFNLPAPNRSDTLQTESTLVAEDGQNSPTRLRPLMIVQKMGRIKERSRSPSRKRLLRRTESPEDRPVYKRTVPHPVGPRLM